MRYLSVILLLATTGASALAQPMRPASFTSRTELAAVYPDELQDRRMADGSRLGTGAVVIAHRELALGSFVMLRNPRSGRSVRARVADRGPYGTGVSLLLSQEAGRRIGMRGDDVGLIEIEPIADRGLNASPVDSEPVEPSSPNAATSRPGAPTSRPDAPTDRTAPASRDAAQPDPPASAFSVQLGSFGTRAAAEVAGAPFEDVWIAEAVADGRTVYRVFHGRYTTREQAEAWAERLNRLGASGYVRTIPAGRP